MKMKKNVLILILLVCSFVCLVTPQPVSADDDIISQNLYTRKLILSGKIDVVTGKLIANITVSTIEQCEIYTTMDVYQYVDGRWQFYTSFRNPRTGVYKGQTTSYSDNCKVDKNYDYKIIASAYVKSVEDQISEVITESSTILPYE